MKLLSINALDILENFWDAYFEFWLFERVNVYIRRSLLFTELSVSTLNRLLKIYLSYLQSLLFGIIWKVRLVRKLKSASLTLANLHEIASFCNSLGIYCKKLRLLLLQKFSGWTPLGGPPLRARLLNSALNLLIWN